MRLPATGAESFLIGRLLALSARASAEPAGINSDRWQSETPAIVAEVFDEDLARLGGKAPLARALLTALAWAKGPGLPWENVWIPVARALAEDSDDADQPPITDEDVRWLFDKAGAYIVEDLGSGERSVYRPFHDMLARHLRGEPNTEQRRARIEQRITDALLATVAIDSQGRRDWRTAHPYLRTYLARHAEAAGRETVGILAKDTGFLAVADPVTFSFEQPKLFNDALINAAQRAWSVYNTRPWWFDFRPPDRLELWLRDNPRQSLAPRLARARAREYVISCGAALSNLRLAIRTAGRDLVVWLLPDPEHADPMRPPALLASVEIVVGRVKEPSATEQELYEAIWRWHTNEWPYKISPAPLPVIVAMEDAAAQEGAYLRLLHSRQANGWMRLVAKVDSDPAFTPPFPNYVPRADYGPPPKNRYPRTTKDLWLNTAPQLFERKPQLMALSTDDDEPVDWLRPARPCSARS